MPSGAKKRRAARRKQQEEAQTKQTDASVEKELEQSNLSIGEVADETKVATVYGNTVEENEIPLLNDISNDDNIVSNDVSAVSQNAGCIIKTTESGENLEENESLGVFCDDAKAIESTSLLVPDVCVSNHSNETELLTGAPEEIVTMDDLLSIFTMSPEEVSEYLGLDKNRLFFFREAQLPVVTAQPTSNENVEEVAPKSAENTAGSSGETTSDSKETQVVSTIAVSPSTENQAHVASPVTCNPECTDIKKSIENLMARVGEIESSVHIYI